MRTNLGDNGVSANLPDSAVVLEFEGVSGRIIWEVVEQVGVEIQGVQYFMDEGGDLGVETGSVVPHMRLVEVGVSNKGPFGAGFFLLISAILWILYFFAKKR